MYSLTIVNCIERTSHVSLYKENLRVAKSSETLVLVGPYIEMKISTSFHANHDPSYCYIVADVRLDSTI